MQPSELKGQQAQVIQWDQFFRQSLRVWFRLDFAVLCSNLNLFLHSSYPLIGHRGLLITQIHFVDNWPYFNLGILDWIKILWWLEATYALINLEMDNLIWKFYNFWTRFSGYKGRVGILENRMSDKTGTDKLVNYCLNI